MQQKGQRSAFSGFLSNHCLYTKLFTLSFSTDSAVFEACFYIKTSVIENIPAQFGNTQNLPFIVQNHLNPVFIFNCRWIA